MIAAAAFLALPSTPALGVSYVVDRLDDANLTACTGAANDCTLRGAIVRANGTGNGDVIAFDPSVFPLKPSAATILLAGTLPAMTGGSDFLGTGSQGVIVRGVEGGPFNCFSVSSGGNSITGIQITDCNIGVELAGPGSANTLRDLNIYDTTWGIVIRPGSSTNSVFGGRIGTNIAGEACHAEGGNTRGVYVEGNFNVVFDNVISCNTDGMVLANGASNNEVTGNRIGTDPSGTIDLGNIVGINISRYFTSVAPSSNTIGGLLPGEGNIVSGNSIVNIFISDTGTINNSFIRNTIGPGPDGCCTGGMANGDGIQIVGGAGANVIGPRNVISDNVDGVQISGSGTIQNVVKGNFIGTNIFGSALPNTTGVRIDQAASNDDIGGTAPGEGNVIAFNTGVGVYLEGSGIGNGVRGNSIYSNGAFYEIDRTFNEFAPPIVTSTIQGTVSGYACANCEVDIFSDESLDARFYEGSVTADAEGSFTFVNGAPFVAANITTTSTNTVGETSELSTFLAIDSDADGTTDASDADDDNDGMPDTSDACRVFPEDYDGHQDADGCPDPDNDADGVCDAGLTSVSCSGSDTGKTAFFGAGHNHTNPTIDCRNTPEDYDAFKDADGCPEPDNDNDGFPDASDQCPGDDNLTGPDGVLGSGEDQNHNGILNTGEDTVVVDGVLTTDDVVLTFEDYDLILNTDGCHDSPGDDRDGDGYTDEAEELHIGTRADDPCGTDAWPSDLVGTGISANRFDIVDLGSFVAPLRRINTSPGEEPRYNIRWDLKPGPIVPTGKHINVADLGATIAGLSGFPPMFGGQKAIGRTCIVAP